MGCEVIEWYTWPYAFERGYKACKSSSVCQGFGCRQQSSRQLGFEHVNVGSSVPIYIFLQLVRLTFQQVGIEIRLLLTSSFFAAVTA
jgi:hypothetical protein